MEDQGKLGAGTGLLDPVASEPPTPRLTIGDLSKIKEVKCNIDEGTLLITAGTPPRSLVMRRGEVVNLCDQFDPTELKKSASIRVALETKKLLRPDAKGDYPEMVPAKQRLNTAQKSEYDRNYAIAVEREHIESLPEADAAIATAELEAKISSGEKIVPTIKEP